MKECKKACLSFNLLSEAIFYAIELSWLREEKANQCFNLLSEAIFYAIQGFRSRPVDCVWKVSIFFLKLYSMQ